MTDHGDSSDTEYQAYLDQRKALNDMELEVSGRYDQWILTLAGGALGFSLTFMEKIAKQPILWTFWLLGVAWVFLLITLVLSLSSLLTSQSAIRKQRDILDENLGEENPTTESQKNNLATCTHYLNVLSIITFAFGIILLCIFSILNSPKEAGNHGEKRSRDKKESCITGYMGTENRWRGCPPCSSQNKATITGKNKTEPKEKINEGDIEKMREDKNRQSDEKENRGFVPPSAPIRKPTNSSDQSSNSSDQSSNSSNNSSNEGEQQGK